MRKVKDSVKGIINNKEGASYIPLRGYVIIFTTLIIVFSYVQNSGHITKAFEKNNEKIVMEKIRETNY